MTEKAVSDRGSGRFGSRYGKRIRDGMKKAIGEKKAKYACPSCSRKSVVRESAGVWVCVKCKVKYASGAYKFGE
ncbi:MAG: 50S ribosomal protein L37ae [Candidatus Aenigmatarchaeota archaeon]